LSGRNISFADEITLHEQSTLPSVQTIGLRCRRRGHIYNQFNV